MIECIFTLDYEIYGNGEGSLDELVYQPTEQLMRIFDSAGAKFVCFVEAAEFELIEAHGSDAAIERIRRQILALAHHRHEIALHLHPQWYRARLENGRWRLDDSEYNLCTLPRERIVQIIDRAVMYLRKVLDDPDFTPHSFRAGNWLFQPADNVAPVLADYGIKVDSSVFKGGRQHKHHLDYRPACRNGPFWRFRHDANRPNPDGELWEIPIYTEQVPFWKMLTRKRVGLQKRASAGAGSGRWNRLRDFLRLRHPLKFDFCRMTLDELISMTERALREDRDDPQTYRPLVAIGHSKDLSDFETVRAYLAFLNERGIAVSTLKEACRKCKIEERCGSLNLYESYPHTD